MTEQEIDEEIKTIAIRYGVQAQSMQACEECGELMWFYCISHADVGEIIERKLRRQLERIKEET